MEKYKRTHSNYATAEIQKVLKVLSSEKNCFNYRFKMFQLGMELGHRIILENPLCKYFYLVCTVEDADYLAKGIMESLSLKDRKFNIACFWNFRETAGETGRISPVIRKYVEPIPENSTRNKIIIVKSLISGACVVKTNIKEVIDQVKPNKIIIAAPVMHKDAQKKLEDEFTKAEAKLFQYIYFAKDYSTIDGHVHPGIGDVYKLYGLKDQNYKNRYTPKIVVSRRTSYYENNSHSIQ